MLTDQEKKALLHFTHSSSVLNDTRLKSIACALTNGRIAPTSREDAVKCILLHAESLHHFMNNKKVTAAVLLKYLHELNVPAPGTANKEELIYKILYSEWNFPVPTSLQQNGMNMGGQNIISNAKRETCPSSGMNPSMNNNFSNMGNTSMNNQMYPNQSCNLAPSHYAQQPPNNFSQFNSQAIQCVPTIPFANSGQAAGLQYSGHNMMSQPNSMQPNNSLQLYNNSPKPNTSPYSEAIASRQLLKEVNSLAFDDFMVNFAKMFYELLNNPAGGYLHGLNQSHFFEECKLMIQIKGQEEDIEQTGESVIDALRLLSDLRREHQLSFNPNLTPEGVRGKTDSHGLIYAVASGTLHHGRGKLVGVYEQSFILRKDPFEQNSCKIADSTLILRSNNSVNTFSQLLLPTSSRNNERNLAIQNAPSSGNQLQLTYHS